VNIRGVQAFLQPSLICEPLEAEKHTVLFPEPWLLKRFWTRLRDDRIQVKYIDDPFSDSAHCFASIGPIYKTINSDQFFAG
jgi:hypothetical protein